MRSGCRGFESCSGHLIFFRHLFCLYIDKTYISELTSLMMNSLFEICRVTYNVYGETTSGPMCIVSTINRSNSQSERPGSKYLVIDVPLQLIFDSLHLWLPR